MITRTTARTTSRFGTSDLLLIVAFAGTIVGGLLTL